MNGKTCGGKTGSLKAGATRTEKAVSAMKKSNQKLTKGAVSKLRRLAAGS